jgi:tetratricopeptide (TPR) repeat protein
MLLKWLKAEKATEVGTALADAFVSDLTHGRSGARSKTTPREAGPDDLQWLLTRFLQRVDRDAGSLQLNVFKRATLANTFKWRLLEKGIDKHITDDATQALIVRLSANRSSPAGAAEPVGTPTVATKAASLQSLLSQGNACMTRGAYREAIGLFQELLRLNPGHATARNTLGAALCKVGEYHDAEEQFRLAIAAKRDHWQAHSNLGTVLRWKGRVMESEAPLRHVLQAKPTDIDAQLSLSATLILLGRWPEAKALLESVRKRAPRNVAALVGLAEIAGPEGRFAEAESLFRRAIEIDPKAHAAWAGLVFLRKMTPEDKPWLERAEAIAAGQLAPLEEANIRYAMGKFHDDLGEFHSAFDQYRRANELQKVAAEPYDREARARFVEDMRRVYARATLAGPQPGASDSVRPIFVVGMPRSGTSMVEQIIASHPLVRGVGEFGFWSDAMRRHESAIRAELPGEPLRRQLAAGYLRALNARCPDAPHVVDKTPFNSDYLGLIHAVFPRARIIYVRRSAIDTCLSCYFQQFSTGVDFSTDLSDLAHYYRQHARLVAHWREVLPAGTLLEVRYEDVTGDQERSTRAILDFLGLEWDERCLDFRKTVRTVMTASFWQVRQEMYRRAGARWHNYRKYIRPLLTLRDLDNP